MNHKLDHSMLSVALPILVWGIKKPLEPYYETVSSHK